MAFQFDRFLDFPRPWVCVFGWPEPVGANPDAIRAAIFSGEIAKAGLDAVLVRDDGGFLEFSYDGRTWSLFSGRFIGGKSKRDSFVVRTDFAGSAIAPKRGIMRLLPGNNSAECTQQEAVMIALDFVNFTPLPSGFAWWQQEGK